MSRTDHQAVAILRRSSRVVPQSWRTSVILFGLVSLCAAATGCGELEPLVEQESVDLQLTVDTLRTQARDAQRTVMELRTEIEARRQELADAQVARAEMEGRLREAERRLLDARQVIELQREELVAARTERERVYRSRGPSKSGGKPRQNVSASRVAPSARVKVTPATLPSASPIVEQAAIYTGPIRHVSVKPGDTLWSLARKHGVSLTQLRSLNHLAGNLIIVGQALRIPGESVPPDSAGARGEGAP